MHDLSSVLIWWATILIISLTVLPITINLFGKFTDRGYIFSKVIGLLFSSYLIWILGSLHLLPFTKISIILVLIFLSAISIVVFTKKNQAEQIFFPWKWAILEELLFLGSLIFWCFVRGNEPSIRGLEKFMDYGFVNSILKANYFPPLDMWLTKSPDYTGGYFINYYYFGHYYTAFLTKLSGINSAITYNLMISTLYAFTFALSFSLGSNLLYFFLSLKQHSKGFYELQTSNYKLKLIFAGLLTAFIITLGGNLHTIYTFTSGYPNETPKPFWQLDFGFFPERYWYPNATRFIPNTIHEFPIYSFVVSDLHGHVADIPFVLLTIALLLNLIIISLLKHQTQETNIPKGNFLTAFLDDYRKINPIPLSQIFLIGFLIAVMYMTNAWDGLIYLVLTGVVFLYIIFKTKNSSETFINVFTKTASAGLFLLFFFLLANFPFMVNFRPFISGLGVLCAPNSLADKKIGPFLFEKDHCQRSEIWMMALLWGFFYYNVFGFVVFALKPVISRIAEKEKSRFYLIRMFHAKIQSFNIHHPIDVFILILILISTLLLIFPELFYIKDIYPAHYRANTMFKLGYQAFMMLSLVSGFIVFRLKSVINKSLAQVFYNALYILLFTLIAIYPYFAIVSYYGRLQLYKGQDGIIWMQEQYADDYTGILWIRENLKCPEGALTDCDNQPVIAEAVGDSYTDYARVSSYTGLPTIVGWPVHEWLWRGSYDEAGKRIPEVQTLYESLNMDETRKIINKYNVRYVFVGNLEREKYPGLNAAKFENLGEVVFEQGGTKIYRISP